jgi:hypothetical protein
MTAHSSESLIDEILRSAARPKKPCTAHRLLFQPRGFWDSDATLPNA